MSLRRTVPPVLAALVLVMAPAAPALAAPTTSWLPPPPAASGDPLAKGARFYLDPESDALEAVRTTTGQARADALTLATIPTAHWFTKGTPAEVREGVNRYVTGARITRSTPVLVAYDIPGRDCGQYSDGGATSTAEYAAWIDAFAQGIGSRPAVVILEPDSLGLVPYYTDVNGVPGDCRPQGADPATAARDRFAQLNHAVDALAALPSTKVYLDGTNPHWLGPGDAATRLRAAGIDRADGFFTNVSSFYTDVRLTHVTHWISDCLYLMEKADYPARNCPGQYYPADPDDDRTWPQVDTLYDQALADHGLVRDPAVQKHAVWDTSRNGRGGWSVPTGTYPDNQDWCNPPGRGAGRTPSTDTGDPFVDARLWVKTAGASDGECLRGTAGPTDPARGVVDPPAGEWFPAFARELIANANPKLPFVVPCPPRWCR